MEEDEEDKSFYNANNNQLADKMIVPIPSNIMNSNSNSKLIMGFGGIPISYTLRSRDRLPALTPEN